MTKILIKKADLFYTEGSSDKEYHCQLFQTTEGYTVEFQYGRRGSALTAGTKTAAPVAEAAAHKVFDKLVKEKTAKGYTPNESGEVFTGGASEQRLTGFQPQLLNPLTEDEARVRLERMASGDSMDILQEKHDGERRGLKAERQEVIGSNRKGLQVALPESVAQAIRGRHLELDGELIGARYVAFDLLMSEGRDLRSLPYEERLALLEAQSLPPPIEVAKSYRGADARLALESIQARRGEGVVFKDPKAPYSAGRPASGGPALKYKFYATATVVVLGVHASKRSISVGAYDTEGRMTKLGNVTVPANQAIPAKDTLVEVRYLYAYPGGALYQPTLLGLRTDLENTAATVAQLKYKAGPEDEDEL